MQQVPARVSEKIKQLILKDKKIDEAIDQVFDVLIEYFEN